VTTWRPQRGGRDPLVAVFDGYCCWPGCRRPVGEIVAPLCKHHLLKAWRIVQETGQHVLMGAATRPVPPPQDRIVEGEFVYFIRFRDRVKIGYTTDLPHRLAVLPHDEVLHVQPGTRVHEKRCHAAFAHLRENGEWFRAEPDLMAFIDDLRAAA
jgi:hypothetical protein